MRRVAFQTHTLVKLIVNVFLSRLMRQRTAEVGVDVLTANLEMEAKSALDALGSQRVRRPWMWFLLVTVLLVLLFGAGTPAVNAIRALQAEHPRAAKADSENGELASDTTLGSKRFGSLHNIAEHAATVQAGASSPPPPKPEALVTPTAVATPGAADVDEIIKIELTVNGQPMAVRLKLLPRHSPSSVEFVRHAAASRCRGELYRSENHFLVQGRISCSALPDGPKVPQVIKGQCPLGVKVEGRQCPSHDPQ